MTLFFDINCVNKHSLSIFNITRLKIQHIFFQRFRVSNNWIFDNCFRNNFVFASTIFDDISHVKQVDSHSDCFVIVWRNKSHCSTSFSSVYDFNRFFFIQKMLIKFRRIESRCDDCCESKECSSDHDCYLILIIFSHFLFV